MQKVTYQFKSEGAKHPETRSCLHEKRTLLLFKQLEPLQNPPPRRARGMGDNGARCGQREGAVCQGKTVSSAGEKRTAGLG